MSRRCDKCFADIGGTEVCPECGAIQQAQAERDVVECENHQDERAVGCCVVCGKPVCGDCSRSRDGKFFCDEPEHERLLEAWRVLALTESESEAEMIAVNLKQRGFDPRVFPRESHITMFWFPELRRFRVMLPKEKVNEGRETLAFLGLGDDKYNDERRENRIESL